MGCSSSMYSIRRKKTKRNIPQVSIFVPPLRIPVQSHDLHKMLRGLIPKDIADRISSLLNQIVLVAEDTGESAIPELQRALEEYLALLLSLTKKENGLQEMVEFKWKNLVDGQEKEACVQSSWFELLSVIHMMAVLTLTEANSMLVSKDHNTCCERVVSSDNMRNDVEIGILAPHLPENCFAQAFDTTNTIVTLRFIDPLEN